MERILHHCELDKGAEPVEIAKAFLKSEGYQDSNGPHIRHYRSVFYLYEGTHYKEIQREELQLKIIAFLQDQKELSAKATTHFSQNILMNIAALVQVDSLTTPPCFLKRPYQKASRYISFKNGILDLDEYMKGKTKLIEHTSDFFTFSSLPFEYNKKSEGTIWKNFLNEVLPDKEMQRLLQEWFGYNMTYDTSHEKFVLLYGQGGDGKTVIVTVLTEILGFNNISALSLEQFCPSRTFPLYEMAGKLANITGEIGDIKKVAEGVLKNVVSGGEMMVERKGKNPVLVRFTAKLTFLTNEVPRFRDRSEGLWRRIIFIPFRVQTLDPKKQNKNYRDRSWWINSGEIPGIMNWALEGLLRLTKRGHFIEPKACLEMKAEYKAESNPAALFLRENYEIKENGNIGITELYMKYARAIKDQGGTPLGQNQFSREVRKTFPQAKSSENARIVKSITGFDTRTRVWENIGKKP